MQLQTRLQTESHSHTAGTHTAQSRLYWFSVRLNMIFQLLPSEGVLKRSHLYDLLHSHPLWLLPSPAPPQGQTQQPRRAACLPNTAPVRPPVIPWHCLLLCGLIPPPCHSTCQV